MVCIKKYRFIIVVVLLIALITSFYSCLVVKSVSRFNGFTIVIDAGHGGRDGGSVGQNGTIEKEINLTYAMALKDKLVEKGFKVELTRKNDDGLYNEFAKNKKQSDMLQRFKIIEKTNPNLVISIHMNSFSDKSVKGALTYFRKGDEASQYCADLIQKSFFNDGCATKIKSKVGDYYILNCSYYTAVLIECGFISNFEEEKLLNTEEYRNRIIDAIYKGVLIYFGVVNI